MTALKFGYNAKEADAARRQFIYANNFIYGIATN